MEGFSPWIAVCDLNQLPAQSARGVALGDDEVILINWSGCIYAYLNHCPHRGWPLNLEPDRFLDAEQRFLQCSNHLALFEVESGMCVAGPCAGQGLEPLPVEVRAGTIHLQAP